MEFAVADIYKKKGVIHVIAKTSFSVDIVLAQKLISETMKRCKGKPYPVLFDLSEMKYMSKEAREYIRNKGLTNITAAAFLATTRSSQAFIHSYLSIYNPDIPVKVYAKKEDALKWLQQFVDVGEKIEC